jgi:hypothetical protein
MIISHKDTIISNKCKNARPNKVHKCKKARPNNMK